MPYLEVIEEAPQIAKNPLMAKFNLGPLRINSPWMNLEACPDKGRFGGKTCTSVLCSENGGKDKTMSTQGILECGILRVSSLLFWNGKHWCMSLCDGNTENDENYPNCWTFGAEKTLFFLLAQFKRKKGGYRFRHANARYNDFER